MRAPCDNAWSFRRSGEYQTFVRPLDDMRRRAWVVSDGAGSDAIWSPGGDALLLEGWRSAHAGPVTGDDEFDVGASTELRRLDYHDASGPSLAISPDGRRVLIQKTGGRERLPGDAADSGHGLGRRDGADRGRPVSHRYYRKLCMRILGGVPWVIGAGYDLTSEPGRTMWNQVETSLKSLRPAELAAESLHENAPRDGYGEPIVTVPRLGQGSFRLLVTDAYERRCAVTGERVLPVLEAAHIKPFSLDGPHQVDNGLLLRRDLHTLLDRGYVTVTPGRELEVSRRIKEDWENGREYYQLHGRPIRVPARPDWEPSSEFLRWHNENVYRG